MLKLGSVSECVIYDARLNELRLWINSTDSHQLEQEQIIDNNPLQEPRYSNDTISINTKEERPDNYKYKRRKIYGGKITVLLNFLSRKEIRSINSQSTFH